MNFKLILGVCIILMVVGGVVGGGGADIGTYYGFDDDENLYTENCKSAGVVLNVDGKFIPLGSPENYPSLYDNKKNLIRGENIGTGVIAKDDGASIEYKHGKETEKRKFENLKKDSLFVFKDGKLTGAEFTVGGEEGSSTKYKFGNYEYELQKDTKVILKDKILLIFPPDEGIIKKPIRIPNVEGDELIVAFGNNNRNIINGYVIQENGKDYKFNEVGGFEDENTLLSFDTKLGEFYVTKAVIDNLKIGAWPNQDYKTYVLFDEDAIKEVGKEWPFIYIGNKEKFIMGSPKGKMSASVELIDGSIGGIEKEDNDRFIIQALYGKNLIKIEDKGTEEIPVIEAKGEYAVISSNKLYYYWKENERPIIGISKREDLTSPDFHLISLDSEGKGLKHTYNIKGKDVEVDIVDLFVFDKEFYASSKEEGKEALSKSVFYSLDKEYREKLLKASPNTQLKILGIENGEERIKAIDELRKVVIGEKLRFMSLKNPESFSSLQDVRYTKERYGLGSTYEDYDSVTTVHETTHGINSAIRNKYGGTGNVNAFYLLNGEYVVLKEPGIKLSDVRDYVPENMKGNSFYNLYLVSQAKDWNNEPLYVLDELTAYTNGGIASLEMNKRESMNIPEAMVSSMALGNAIKNRDRNYWNSVRGEEFKEFLAFSLERSMDVHIRQTGNRGQALKTFESLTDSRTRQFARDTFGESWAQEYLGV